MNRAFIVIDELNEMLFAIEKKYMKNVFIIFSWMCVVHYHK